MDVVGLIYIVLLNIHMLIHNSFIIYSHFPNWYLNHSQQGMLFLLLILLISISSHRQVALPLLREALVAVRSLFFLLYNVLHLCAIFLRQYHGLLVTFFSSEVSHVYQSKIARNRPEVPICSSYFSAPFTYFSCHCEKILSILQQNSLYNELQN